MPVVPVDQDEPEPRPVMAPPWYRWWFWVIMFLVFCVIMSTVNSCLGATP